MEPTFQQENANIMRRTKTLTAITLCTLSGIGSAAYAAFCTDVTNNNLHVGQFFLELSPSNVGTFEGGFVGENQMWTSLFPGWGESLGFLNTSPNFHAQSLMIWTQELSTSGCGTGVFWFDMYYGLSAGDSCDASMPGFDTRLYYLDTCAGGNSGTYSGGKQLQFTWLGSSLIKNVYSFGQSGFGGLPSTMVNKTTCHRVWPSGCTNCC
jgi:hypothetical protein